MLDALAMWGNVQHVSVIEQHNVTDDCAGVCCENCFFNFCQRCAVKETRRKTQEKNTRLLYFVYSWLLKIILKENNFFFLKYKLTKDIFSCFTLSHLVSIMHFRVTGWGVRLGQVTGLSLIKILFCSHSYHWGFEKKRLKQKMFRARVIHKLTLKYQRALTSLKKYLLSFIAFTLVVISEYKMLRTLIHSKKLSQKKNRNFQKK